MEAFVAPRVERDAKVHREALREIVIDTFCGFVIE